MAIQEDELQADKEIEALPFDDGPAPSEGEGGEGETLYPPGVKLFGEEKRERDRRVAEEVARRVDPVTGRLRASDAQRVYQEVGHRFGLSASGVILRTPSHLKPTNAETLEFARSQKGKPAAGPAARRRRAARASQRPAEPERRKKRDASVAQRVRKAVEEFLDPTTGRIPAARATEVYRLLAQRFERTPGTISNYLRGLTPTASECAALRWQRHRERAGVATAPAATSPETESDLSAHPAALFPTPKSQPAPRRGPKTMKERQAELMGPDGRLIDYDESFQMQRRGETIQTKLDEATEEFLRSFRVQQAAEFLDALRDCGRALNQFVLQMRGQFQEFHEGLEATGQQVFGVAEYMVRELQHRHAREMEELRAATDRQIQELNDYIAALEEENTRMLAKLREVAAILGSVESSGSAPERAVAPAATPDPSRRVRPGGPDIRTE